MSLYTHIENLRRKPEHIRRQAAFWYSFGITAVIFAFWLGSFTPAGSSAKSAVADTIGQASTPAQSLVAGVGSLFDSLKEMIFGAKTIQYSSVQLSPNKH